MLCLLQAHPKGRRRQWGWWRFGVKLVGNLGEMDIFLRYNILLCANGTLNGMAHKHCAISVYGSGIAVGASLRYKRKLT